MHQIDVLQGYRHYYLKTISSLHKQYVSFRYLIILFRCIRILELRCRIVGSSILIGNDVFLEMSLTKCLVAYYLLLINNWNSFIKYSLYQGLRLNITLLIYPIKFKFTCLFSYFKYYYTIYFDFYVFLRTLLNISNTNQIIRSWNENERMIVYLQRFWNSNRR